MSNPPPVINPGFFNNAHNISMTGAQFMETRMTIHNNYLTLAPPTVNSIPPLPPLKSSSTFFVGRDEYLQRLKDYFSSHVESQRKAFLLYGLGGIGKTQICLKFIEQNSTLFDDIHWLDASSEATIELGLMQISQAKNAPQEARYSPGSVLQWIAQRSKWLVIYDNADSHYSVVEKFLPPGNRGSIIITSRNGEMKRLVLDSLNVVDMADDEAASLLLKSAMLDMNSDDIKNSAKEIVSELGGIPLALDQAGAYMCRCGLGIDTYLKLYKASKNNLLSRKEFKGASGYGRSTYGTWDVSMERIKIMASTDDEQEAQAAQSAIMLLNSFAFLNHENIPEELFRNAAVNYISKKSSYDSVAFLDHQNLFLSENDEWDRTQFLDGVQVLLSFSLIKALNHVYSMHILVNEWSKSCIPKNEMNGFYHKARALLSCAIVVDWHCDSYVFCKLLAPHIRSNLLHGLKSGLQTGYHDHEYDEFAFVFHRIGSWDEEERILQVAVKERGSRLGLDHLDTLTTMHNLASIYRKQGRLDEAEKLQVEVLNAKKAKLGSDHPNTLTTMHNLALTYRRQGRLDEAEKLQVEASNASKAKLGSDHPDTLTTMDNLASIYRKQGRLDEAEKLQVEVLNARKAKLGSDHPHTLTTMGNLTSIYRKQGRLDEAEKLEVDVLNARKAKLGSDHPQILTTMHNLASTYMKQGRLDEAEKLEVEVLNARKAKLGSDHPGTLTTMDNLALAYKRQGRWDEAEKLEVEVLNARIAKLGPDHPDTLTIMDNLALTYKKQGRLDEAEKLGVEVLNARKAKLGLDHPDTLTTMHNLASIYKKQGRLDEAEKLQVEVLNASKIKLGSDHPDTLTTMDNLASIYRKQGRLDEAEKLEVEVLNARKAKSK